VPSYPETVRHVDPTARVRGPGLLDAAGRRATNLRVSVTDRCRLRCVYCLPARGARPLPPARLLRDEEFLRLIRVAVERLGVTRVRFTGGEPLLRPGLEDLLAGTLRLRGQDGPPAVGLTTSGIGLAARAASLVSAGLRRINVSLDTLDGGRFVEMTRRDRLGEVLAGIRAAREAGLDPIKINAVPVRGINDGDAAVLLRWALDHGFLLRFVEQMPLGPAGSWDRERMVPAREIRERLGETFTLLPSGAGDRGHSPARIWRVLDRGGGFLGSVGFIASVTEPFCDRCDRTRLTADGRIRSCLFSRRETDLAGPLRSGADDAELAGLWRTAMLDKPAAHGVDGPGLARPGRGMNAIGG